MRGTGTDSFGCTGEKGPSNEDTSNWCLGWVMEGDANCTQKPEYEYESSAKSETKTITANPMSYGSGGYVLRIKGYITDMQENIELLKAENWVDNRTRSLIVEFSVYNAQVPFNTIHFLRPQNFLCFYPQIVRLFSNNNSIEIF